MSIYSSYASSDNVVVNFSGAITSRYLKVYANNYGQKSKNYAEFHFIDPYLRFMQMPEEFVGYRNQQESGVTVDGVGYFFLERKVYKIDPATRKAEIVATAPQSVFNLAGGFSYASINGKIYLGAISNSATQNSFWEFDPKSNKLTQLADIPSLANKPKLVYATQSHFYYEGAINMLLEGISGIQEFTGIVLYRISGKSYRENLLMMSILAYSEPLDLEAMYIQ